MTLKQNSCSLYFLLLLLFTAAAAVPTAHGQEKQLSRQQILNGDFGDLVQPLPRVMNWVDANHFVLGERRSQPGFDLFLVDARSGERTPYTRPAASGASLSVSEGDIYLERDGNRRRLTQTESGEHNPTFSPDSAKVAFTRGRDLYILEVSSGEEQRITRDGSDVIYNGWSSWVYMEEILGRSTRFKAFWWSPDSKKIAFMRFDDRPVKIFPLHSVEDSYGTLIEQRYPKAGFDNPKVKIGIADVSSGRLTWADYNQDEDQYFGRPYWTPGSNRLWTQWMNRDQDHLIIHEINLADGTKTTIYEEQQDTWIDLDDGDRLQFLDEDAGFLLLSDKSGWMHIYHYGMDGQLISQVTSGDWSVTDLERVDQENGTLFFTARKENSARFDLYRVGLDGTNMKRLTFGDYSHSTSVSPGGDFFVTTYSNVSTPPKMRLMNRNGETVTELADARNAEFSDYKLAHTELVRVETEDGFALPMTITWPAAIDKSKKYPVLVSIYGGPNSGTVYDRWDGLGMNQWWAREGLIQVSIDHRGSGHFGKEGQNYMHRDLGHWEIHDYSRAVEWLIKNYDFIDGDRIGITGFSYGGYVTSLALTKGAGLFDYGLAGGSVTDWHLYDTHYTERYMDRPQDNAEGYKSSSVMTYVDNYKGFLLMVHGSMDDNVHMQNSLQLVSALESAGKDFEFIPYLGGKHGWYNLPGKYRHYRDQRYKFYYQYLLGTEPPAMLIEN